MSNPEENSPTSFAEMTFAEGSAIFEEGDEGDAAYPIHDGRVEIRKGTRSSGPQKLAVLRKGDGLGKLALFDGRPRMAGAIALTEVKAIRISGEEFLVRLATMDPSMASPAPWAVGRGDDVPLARRRKYLYSNHERAWLR